MLHVELHTICKITHCVSNYTLQNYTGVLEDLLWVLFALTVKKFPSLEKIFHKRRLRRL